MDGSYIDCVIFDAGDPFVVAFVMVVDADFRTADEGRDGGLSFLCGFAESLPASERNAFKLESNANVNATAWVMCLLSGVMPVLAMLDGRGFLAPVVRR